MSYSVHINEKEIKIFILHPTYQYIFHCLMSLNITFQKILNILTIYPLLPERLFNYFKTANDYFIEFSDFNTFTYSNAPDCFANLPTSLLQST